MVIHDRGIMLDHDPPRSIVLYKRSLSPLEEDLPLVLITLQQSILLTKQSLLTIVILLDAVSIPAY